ncbi:hypothetical protein E1A91_A09G005700v1 [Gossypium mustelinum]|uniref:Uncharacterized protein n=1 Tax=Gossypium mustelinum TaxID=34275 RepID=A0A5D2XSB5_GOSMU|nr:hypothetical protein E1A91_A09G005700v1 [Gossypium mustelinum]
MEEGDKSTGIGGEISTRVSAGSTSWLFASRQRFTIELMPGETTIVSWKRLIKDAQDTSPHLTAPNTEDSLDECCRDDKSTSKQNGLLVKFDKYLSHSSLFTFHIYIVGMLQENDILSLIF